MSLPAPSKGEKKVWPKHPAGSHVVVLADAIHLGFRVTNFSGNEKKQERVVLIWQSGKIEPDSPDGRRFELATEFTYSSYENGNLRPFLESWLGVTFADEAEVEKVMQGLPERVGTSGIASIVHKAKDDKVYVNIKSLAPLMEGQEGLKVVGYTRNPYWAKKIEEYKKQAAEYDAKRAKPVQSIEEFPAALEDDDDDGSLPF